MSNYSVFFPHCVTVYYELCIEKLFQDKRAIKKAIKSSIKSRVSWICGVSRTIIFQCLYYKTLQTYKKVEE